MENLAGISEPLVPPNEQNISKINFSPVYSCFNGRKTIAAIETDGN